MGKIDPLGLEIRRCFRQFSNPRTRAVAGLVNILFGWYAIQPPVPGVRACLQHEYVFNTATGDSYGYDPAEVVRETGRDICYVIPEPIGQCVWNNIRQIAGSMSNYDLLTRNCQTAVNDAVRNCQRQCFPPPRNPGRPSPRLADPQYWRSGSRQ